MPWTVQWVEPETFTDLPADQQHEIHLLKWHTTAEVISHYNAYIHSQQDQEEADPAPDAFGQLPSAQKAAVMRAAEVILKQQQQELPPALAASWQELDLP